MKNATLVFFVMMTAHFAHAEFQFKPVQVPIKDAALPVGLSHADNASITIAGKFPNGCYRWLKAEVGHLSATTHVVRAVASVSDAACIMVLIPFKEDINLGMLPAGEHTVRFLTDGGEYFERKLKVL